MESGTTPAAVSARLPDPSLDTALARMQASRLRPSEAPYIVVSSSEQYTLRELYAQRAILAADTHANVLHGTMHLAHDTHPIDYAHLRTRIVEREESNILPWCGQEMSTSIVDIACMLRRGHRGQHWCSGVTWPHAESTNPRGEGTIILSPQGTPILDTETPRYCQMCGVAGRLIVPGTTRCAVCAAAVRNDGRGKELL